jgi:3-hydroxybutyryl-CoA dehydrogenase
VRPQRHRLARPSLTVAQQLAGHAEELLDLLRAARMVDELDAGPLERRGVRCGRDDRGGEIDEVDRASLPSVCLYDRRPLPGSVGIIGAGTMGVGVAYVFAAAGFVTIVVEPDDARAQALAQVVAEQSAKGVERGKLTEAQRAATVANVSRVASIEALPAGMDLVVESVPERLSLKRDVLARAERREPGLLASNTSSLSIDALAEGLSRGSAFLGMHFFNPVWSFPIVELIRGAATADDSVARAQALAAAIGKQTVVVRDVPGFATSRLDLIAALEAMRMLEDGVASPEDIDRAVVLAYRHPVGPLRLSDIVGLDVRLDIARSLESVYGERFRAPDILVEKVAAGELGQKSGRGFYDWTEL